MVCPCSAFGRCSAGSGPRPASAIRRHAGRRVCPSRRLPGPRSAPIARPEEFGDVLRALILQSDPRRFPPAPGAAGRVTFARVAAALELSSERHLRKILSGDANITAAFLERLDELFELPGRGVVRARVYRSALGYLPTRVRAEESAASGGG